MVHLYYLACSLCENDVCAMTPEVKRIAAIFKEKLNNIDRSYLHAVNTKRAGRHIL